MQATVCSRLSPSETIFSVFGYVCGVFQPFLGSKTVFPPSQPSISNALKTLHSNKKTHRNRQNNRERRLCVLKRPFSWILKPCSYSKNTDLSPRSNLHLLEHGQGQVVAAGALGRLTFTFTFTSPSIRTLEQQKHDHGEPNIVVSAATVLNLDFED